MRPSLGTLDHQEEVLAARYCRLSEAGYPPREALAIAEDPDADIERCILLQGISRSSRSDA